MNNFFHETIYPLRAIESILRIKYGKGLPDKKRDSTGTYPVYGSNGIVGYHSKSITLFPVIIIGRKGSAGAINFFGSACWPIDTSFYIDEFPSELCPKWIYYCLRSMDFSSHAQGPKPGISRDLLYQIEIPVPPLEEQYRIVSRIEELIHRADEAHRLISDINSELRVFQSAVIAKAFRGEL